MPPRNVRLALASGSLACALFATAACSDESKTATPSASSDAGTDRASSPPDDGQDAGDGGAAPDAPVATKTTAITADIGGVSRSLTRAHFGILKNGDQRKFHVEAYEGGEGCPEENSPSPKRTFIVSELPRRDPGSVVSKADGITSGFLDFVGDQLVEKPTTVASAVGVTIVAIDEGETPEGVEIEVESTFAEGKVSGRIYATYCASMSD